MLIVGSPEKILWPIFCYFTSQLQKTEIPVGFPENELNSGGYSLELENADEQAMMALQEMAVLNGFCSVGTLLQYQVA